MGYRDAYFKDSANKSNNGWYECVRCGKKLRRGDTEIDHILPQHWGGSDDIDNLQCMCRHCNRSKGASLDDCIDDMLDNEIRRNPKKYGLK